MLKKLKQWMKFDTPKSGTPDEWVEFELRFKQEAPARYFLTHTLPMATWKRVSWKYKDVTSWIRYRLVRYHVVHTGLEPGYYELETKMLHANFQLLVDFVEIEKAWMQKGSNEREDNAPFRRLLSYIPFRHVWRDLTFRSRELGLEHLHWEITLDDPELDEHERSDHQARTAREVLDLYLWWKDIRPAREVIPMPEDEFDTLKYGILYTISDKFKRDHPAAYQARKDWSDAIHAQETNWAREDDENLIRLIKIRHSLWT